MIVPVNWIKKYTSIDMPIDELATLIGARLVEIEGVENLAEKYRDVICAYVVDAHKLEGSDHLSLTKIDDGGVRTDVERDANGHIQVVCGAPNVATGQIIAWLPPNSTVPDTYESSDPFILGSRKLCGEMSNGMIASARELDLYDEHDGILVLDDNIKPGTKFTAAYDFNDYLLDIENKSLTHRPDCFGILGFAREVSAIQGKKFNSPDFIKNLKPVFKSSSKMALSAQIDDAILSNRYQAVVMSGVNSSKQASLEIQLLLSKIGMRPISAVVDATNYLMMLTGQPLHAFDYDKVLALSGGKPEIHVRVGKTGEKLSLLDGREIELTTEDIVIAAGEKAIALAGAMGGLETEIDSNTKNIIIESATFDLYKLRATQMRHGIFSEAITRFTKGQPADLTAPVLDMAVKLINEWTGAELASDLAEDYPNPNPENIIELPIQKLNDILGTDVAEADITNVLENTEFEVLDVRDGVMFVKAPWWRADIHIKEDLIEEFGRINGFDNIEPKLPTRDFSAVMRDDFDDLKYNLRKIMKMAGANEVLTYSFVHGDILNKVGLDKNNSYRVVNSISPDLQYYRQTLTPSLLNIVNSNIRSGFENFGIFEINKTHNKIDGFNNENVPIESDMMAFVVANKNSESGAPYYRAKSFLEFIMTKLNLTYELKALDANNDSPILSVFEPKHSAMIVDKESGLFIGVVGEYKRSVQKNFKLPENIAGFELNTRAVLETVRHSSLNYKPLSRFPGSERDICFKLANEINYDELFNAVSDSLDNIDIESDLKPVDIYSAEGSDTKNITLRISFVSYEKTLTGEEVKVLIQKITDDVKSKLDVSVL